MYISHVHARTCTFTCTYIYMYVHLLTLKYKIKMFLGFENVFYCLQIYNTLGTQKTSATGHTIFQFACSFDDNYKTTVQPYLPLNTNSSLLFVY